MRLFGALTSFLLSTNGNVDQLKQRLQFGYDAADEARNFLAEEQYKEAAQSFADAFNLGRKPALALQELDYASDLQQESLQWLIDVCCESSLLHLDHLKDADSARADAWAACVFSQYQSRKPLECMMKVCQEGEDLFGEFQTCQQMLSLPEEELNDKEAREAIAKRLKEIEVGLSNKK